MNSQISGDFNDANHMFCHLVVVRGKPNTINQYERPADTWTGGRECPGLVVGSSVFSS